MNTPSTCPKCQSQDIYEYSSVWTCPSCGHEWNVKAATSEAAVDEVTDDGSIRDSNGNILTDGDSVTVIKELKIKGASSVVKIGTKVKNIRLVDSDDGHNIACKIDGVGAIHLKSEFVRKA
jgi:protein PhnA